MEEVTANNANLRELNRRIQNHSRLVARFAVGRCGGRNGREGAVQVHALWARVGGGARPGEGADVPQVPQQQCARVEGRKGGQVGRAETTGTPVCQARASGPPACGSELPAARGTLVGSVARPGAVISAAVGGFRYSSFCGLRRYESPIAPLAPTACRRRDPCCAPRFSRRRWS